MNRNIKTIQLNTMYKSNGSDLTNPVFDNIHLDDIIGYKIKNAVIPLSVPTFDSRNNQISFSTSNGSYNLTIATGFYNAVSLPTAISTLFNDTTESSTFTCSYSTLTNKLSIASSSIAFQINSTIANSANYELGITGDIALSTQANFQQQLDIGGISMINILSNFGDTDLIGTNYKLLESIVIDESNLGLATYENHSDDYITTQTKELFDLSFQIYDNRFRKIIPSKDYSISLSFLIE